MKKITEEQKLSYMLSKLDAYKRSLSTLIVAFGYDISNFKGQKDSVIFNSLINLPKDEFEKILGRELTEEENEKYGQAAHNICVGVIAKVVILTYHDILEQCKKMGNHNIKTSEDIDKMSEGVKKMNQLL